MMLRRDIKPDVGRETAIGKYVPKLLLIRRIVTFLSNRFRYTPVEGTTYILGYDPANIMKTLFGTFADFHNSYPKGANFDLDVQSHLSSNGGATVVQSLNCDLAFLAKLSSSQGQLVDFCSGIMDSRPDIDKILNSCVATDPNMSAEAFFERRRELVTEEIFDMKEFVEAMRVVCGAVVSVDSRLVELVRVCFSRRGIQPRRPARRPPGGLGDAGLACHTGHTGRAGTGRGRGARGTRAHAC